MPVVSMGHSAEKAPLIPEDSQDCRWILCSSCKIKQTYQTKQNPTGEKLLLHSGLSFNKTWIEGAFFPRDSVLDGRWSFCPVALGKCLRHRLIQVMQQDANLADCR